MIDYALMNQCLYEGKAKEVEQMTKDALAEGRPVQEILTEGLIAGMSVVGEDFKHNILYVPEVLIAARAMKAGMAVLKPLLSAKDSGSRPTEISQSSDETRPSSALGTWRCLVVAQTIVPAVSSPLNTALASISCQIAVAAP